eukprot:15107329-Heterocapsa_arctica.AAC.1
MAAWRFLAIASWRPWRRRGRGDLYHYAYLASASWQLRERQGGGDGQLRPEVLRPTDDLLLRPE